MLLSSNAETDSSELLALSNHHNLKLSFKVSLSQKRLNMTLLRRFARGDFGEALRLAYGE